MAASETHTRVDHCWSCGSAQTIREATRTVAAGPYKKRQEVTSTCDRCGTQLGVVVVDSDVRTAVGG